MFTFETKASGPETLADCSESRLRAQPWKTRAILKFIINQVVTSSLCLKSV